MNEDEVSVLRGQIAQARGKARAVPLIKLGWAYMQAYLDEPPGSRLVRHHLEEGVAALDEGRLLLSSDDPVRAQVEATLGHYQASQGSSYWCEGEHVEKAYRLLRAALDSGSLVPLMAEHTRFHLARVHLSRYLAAPAESAEHAEFDCARELLRGVAERGSTLALDQDSRILLAALAEPSRASLEGVEAAMRSGGRHVPLVGHPEFDPKLSGRDSRRYSHTLVVRGTVPAEPFEPAPPQEAEAEDLEQLRRAAWKLLPSTHDPEESAARLLSDADGPPWLDRFLALTAAVVHRAQPATATDHALLALGFFLRSRGDDDGWHKTDDSAGPAAPVANGDFQAALAALLTALQVLAADSAE